MDKSSGELVTLIPSNSNTVQPVALVRLDVFVPTLKSLENSKKNTLSRTDVTGELTRSSLVRVEGFDKVEVTGPRLDIDNDLKTWVRIIHSFTRHNVIGDEVELSFVESAKLRGIPSSQLSHGLCGHISPSLKRIAGTAISFFRTDEKHAREYITHLVQSAYYDTERDIIQLQTDPRLSELYQFDRKVLLQPRTTNALRQREFAQAFYTFIESLPWDSAPISLTWLCARLNLKPPVLSQNQTVRWTMERLCEIGYLNYTRIQRGRIKFFCIHYRRPRLKAPDDENKESPLQSLPTEKVNPEITRKLTLPEKLGIALGDLEKLFESR